MKHRASHLCTGNGINFLSQKALCLHFNFDPAHFSTEKKRAERLAKLKGVECMFEYRGVKVEFDRINVHKMCRTCTGKKCKGCGDGFLNYELK